MIRTAGLPLARPALRRSCTRIDDLRDIAQADGVAVLVADDEPAIIGGLEELVGGVELPGARRHAAGCLWACGHWRWRAWCGPGRGRCCNCFERARIQFHAHGWLGAAADGHLADAFDLRQFLGEHGIGGIVHCARVVAVGGEGEDEDRRIGRVDLAVAGLFGKVRRQWPRAALMAAWTSRAAASILRLRSNWRTMLVLPRPLEEVISVTPAMRPN